MGKTSRSDNDLPIVCGGRHAIRNPDGSTDIAAYVRIAHRERDAAVVSAMREAAQGVRTLLWRTWCVLSWLGRIRSNAPLQG